MVRTAGWGIGCASWWLVGWSLCIVENVVYDATALKLWVSYAAGKEEAYLRPYVELDRQALDADHDDHDGQADLAPWLASLPAVIR